jgi:hypothetical protein
MAELLSEVKVRATQRSTKNHGPPKADEETQEIENENDRISDHGDASPSET